MADVVSHNETDREGKGSNKYLLSTHHMPGAMVNNGQFGTSQSSLSGTERQLNKPLLYKGKFFRSKSTGGNGSRCR